MPSNTLVIGLDYGTTYTGVSFCETSNTDHIEDRIQIIQNWPCKRSMIGTKEKVPSEVAYPEGQAIVWGSEIPTDMSRYMWTKLELEETETGKAERIKTEQAEEARIGKAAQPETKKVERSRARQESSALSVGGEGSRRDPVDIIADFLRGVKVHLIKNLDDQYGPTLWKTLPITLVVTVPAVWSDAAKARTLQAVEKAGFKKSEFPQLKRTITTTEPEAAALHTIKSLEGSIHNKQLSVGDGFVVCDMGGGTVDLITYRVASVSPITVEEATIGTGDQCGGSFIDRAYLQWLEGKLGISDFIKIAGNPVANHISRTSMSPKLGKMVQYFTLNCKSGFSGEEDYWLPLPAALRVDDDAARGISDGEIRLTAVDMRKMYEFPLQRTQELLVEQLLQAERKHTANMKYVFIVGGFAESPYMYREISALVQSHRQVRAIRPVHAWSAIARGATAKGLEGEGRTAIKARKCRRHYGTICSSLFEEAEHREGDAYIDCYSGDKRAKYQMLWMIVKGQDLKTSAIVHGKRDLAQMFWKNERRVAHLKLMASDMDEAPHRSVDTEVYKVADLAIDLSKVPAGEFKTRRSPSGRRYHSIDYELQITVQSAIEYSLFVNGVRYGSVTADYA